MKIDSENELVGAGEKVETVRREPVNADTALVELGKVSDTQGGFFGAKQDSGAGLTFT